MNEKMEVVYTYLTATAALIIAILGAKKGTISGANIVMLVAIAGVLTGERDIILHLMGRDIDEDS